MRLALLVLLVSFAGCQETQHCGPGRYGSGCQFALVTPMDAGDGGERDSSPDSGADLGVDAFAIDGGPCAMCEGSTPFCYLGSDAGDAGHPMGCVECRDREECRDRDAGPPADAGGPGMTICQDFRCVFGCESDGDCGGNYCRPDHTCSAYPVYSAAELVCAPCDTDANCTRAPGFYCIPFHYVNGGFTHDGNYCLRPATACGGLTAPLSRALTPPPEMSVDGFDTRMGVCGPPTSCEALTDAAGGTTCGVEDECGLAGATDGVCDIGTCSLRCATSNDCPTNRPNCPASRICTP